MANRGRDFTLTDRHRRCMDTQVEEGPIPVQATSSGRRCAATRPISLLNPRLSLLEAMAAKSEAGEALGDFIDIEDDDPLRRVIDDAFGGAVTKVRGVSAR